VTRLPLVLLALLAVAASPARAQLAHGDPIPAAALVDAADQAGLVVVFWDAACPWTERYADRLGALVTSYRPAGVGFAFVEVGGPVEDDAPRRPAGPLVSDADGALVAAFGVQRAPHVFFFGPEQTLLYDGAVDDSPAFADRVQAPYLRLALDQSIAGLPIEVQRTQAFGCKVDGAAPAAGR
jgi:hypothetical protein